jgi:hypothetical protein
MGEKMNSSTILELDIGRKRPATRSGHFTPVEVYSDTQYTGGLMGKDPVWILWSREYPFTSGIAFRQTFKYA